MSLLVTSSLLVTPVPAHAAINENGVESLIPKKALVIESRQSSSRGESSPLLKAEIDTKSLLKTIYSNRKELSFSSERILKVLNEEIHSSAWLEVQKEILSIEGDVVPEFKVTGPLDWRGAVKDISRGKLNLAINGEIIQVDVEEFKGAEKGDDEVTIRIKAEGKKMTMPPRAVNGDSKDADTKNRELNSNLWDFWNDKIMLPRAVNVDSKDADTKYNLWAFWNRDFSFGSSLAPPGVTVTNGNAILAGTVTGVTGAYVASYQYYLSTIKEQEIKAENMRLKMEEKKKKKDIQLAKNQSAEGEQTNKTQITPEAPKAQFETSSLTDQIVKEKVTEEEQTDKTEVTAEAPIVQSEATSITDRTVKEKSAEEEQTDKTEVTTEATNVQNEATSIIDRTVKNKAETNQGRKRNFFKRLLSRQK